MKKVTIENIEYDVLDDSTIVEHNEGSITIKHGDKEVVITKDEIKSLKTINGVTILNIYRYINEVISKNKMLTLLDSSEAYLSSIRKSVMSSLSIINNEIIEDYRIEKENKVKETLDNSKSISEVIEDLKELMDKYGDLKVLYEYEEDDYCGCCKSYSLTTPRFTVEDIYLSRDSDIKAVVFERL